MVTTHKSPHHALLEKGKIQIALNRNLIMEKTLLKLFTLYVAVRAKVA